MKKSLIALVVLSAVATGAFLYSQGTFAPSSASEYFSTDTSGLPDALPSETVELADGDSYALTASLVKKDIGGNEVKMLAYNGMIPGPLIKVAQGSEITISFTNNTDVETTIHSHGVRLENEFDGVVDVTQAAIQPGQSFTYKIKFPDAGIYWYHPHIREDYAQELGLYGNYLVIPTGSVLLVVGES